MIEVDDVYGTSIPVLSHRRMTSIFFRTTV